MYCIWRTKEFGNNNKITIDSPYKWEKFRHSLSLSQARSRRFLIRPTPRWNLSFIHLYPRLFLTSSPNLTPKFTLVCSKFVLIFDTEKREWRVQNHSKTEEKRKVCWQTGAARHGRADKTRGIYPVYFIAVWDCGWKGFHQKKGAEKNVYPLDKKAVPSYLFPLLKIWRRVCIIWGLSSPSSRVLSHAVRCSPAVKIHPSCAHEHATGRRRGPTSTDN